MVLLVIETSNIKEASLKGNLIYEFDSKLDLIKEIKDQAIANHKEFTQNDPLGKVIYGKDIPLLRVYQSQFQSNWVWNFSIFYMSYFFLMVPIISTLITNRINVLFLCIVCSENCILLRHLCQQLLHFIHEFPD